MNAKDSTTFVPAAESRLGGGDFVISLTPEQKKALGGDARELVDWLHTAMWAMTLLRTDADRRAAGPSTWSIAVSDLETSLLPRLQGVRDAVVRAHSASGGSLSQLGDAMDVSRSTAQDRLAAITKPGPRRAQATVWEQWAVSGTTEYRNEAQGGDAQ